jgi:hypothetical protein
VGEPDELVPDVPEVVLNLMNLFPMKCFETFESQSVQFVP